MKPIIVIGFVPYSVAKNLPLLLQIARVDLQYLVLLKEETTSIISVSLISFVIIISATTLTSNKLSYVC